MIRPNCVLLCTVALLAPRSTSAAADEPHKKTDLPLRQAVSRALAPIENSVRQYPEQRHCFSCHHQAVPALALRIAQKQGFVVSEESFEAIDLVVTADLQLAQAAYDRGIGQGGGATRAGYALWTLKSVEHEPDPTTQAVASYLAKAMRSEGAWRTSSNRPPSEASWVTTSAAALHGLTAFPPDEPEETRTQRFDKARHWFEHVAIKDTEDAVFRLWGLQLTRAAPATIQHAATLLVESQNPDGGWSQLPDMPSDAYATGSALVALALAADFATHDSAYQRGLIWLLVHQKTDGTWHVASRSNPFQPYFESGFPYGKDQFISMAASAWATAALALACDPP